MEFLKDIWGFFKERKKWWLMPLTVLLLLIGLLLLATGNTVLAPFIYALF